MRKRNIFAALALSTALALGITTPAFAADTTTVQPTVSKTLQTNVGSAVSEVFAITATPVELTLTGTDNNGYTIPSEVTMTTEETDSCPTLTIGSSNTISVTAANADADVTNTGNIAGTFDHAGYYAYHIKETAGSTSGMTYDSTVYTLLVVCKNGSTSIEPTYYAYKGELSSLNVGDTTKKVSDSTTSDTDGIHFTSTYTEMTPDTPSDTTSTDPGITPKDPDDPDNLDPDPTDNDAKGKALTITKQVTGDTGDKAKKWNFTVVLQKPTYVPSDWTFDDITIAGSATDSSVTYDDNSNPTKATFKFKLTNAQDAYFKNVVVGTTYTVSETEENTGGYTTTYTVNTAPSTATVISDSAVNYTGFKNEMNDITPTGVLLDNAPFIVLGVVGVGGIVLYGLAKRKLLA